MASYDLKIESQHVLNSGCSQLFSSNKITHYLKELATTTEKSCPYKLLMPKIAPLKNYSTLIKIKAEVITPKEFFGEISCSETQLYKNK